MFTTIDLLIDYRGKRFDAPPVVFEVRSTDDSAAYPLQWLNLTDGLVGVNVFMTNDRIRRLRDVLTAHLESTSLNAADWRAAHHTTDTEGVEK